jgi:tetratricopeptide (TPR) repeat protein
MFFRSKFSQLKRGSTFFRAIAGLWLAVFILAGPINCSFAEPSLDFEIARTAMQNQDWETANYTWRHILSDQPQNLEALQGLAKSLYNTGYYQESLDWLLDLPKKTRPLSVDYSIARTYKAMKKYSNSKAAYVELLIKSPYQANAVREAQELLPFLSSAEQKDLNALLTMVGNTSKKRGDEDIRQKKYQEACAYYEIAATRFHTVGIINDYALLLLLTGQYQKAHQQFDLLKHKDKLGFSEAKSNAAIASLSIGNFSEAKAEIQAAITGADNNRLKAKLYNNMGYILEMSRHRSEAQFAYEHALALDPAMLTAQLNLAFIQQANRDYDLAVNNYLSILKTNPQHAEVWNRLGFAYELQYKAKLAQGAYRKAIQLEPENADYYYNLATLYKKMGKITEMNAVLKELAEMHYKTLETASAQKQGTTANNGGSDLKKNPLKFMTLFSSNSQLSASLR